MKTRSTRTKSAPVTKNIGIAAVSMVIGLLSIAGVVYFFYALIMLFYTLSAGDITPYIINISLLIVSIFAGIAAFHYYGKYKG